MRNLSNWHERQEESGRANEGRRWIQKESSIGLFMVVRGGLPGMLGPCKADLTKRWIRPRPRARGTLDLWARNIETQDVLLCHPGTGDLLVMNIVAHGGTWPSRPRGVLPKYVRRLAFGRPSPPHPMHVAIFIPKCHVNHRRALRRTSSEMKAAKEWSNRGERSFCDHLFQIVGDMVTRCELYELEKARMWTTCFVFRVGGLRIVVNRKIMYIDIEFLTVLYKSCGYGLSLFSKLTESL